MLGHRPQVRATAQTFPRCYRSDTFLFSPLLFFRLGQFFKGSTPRPQNTQLSLRETEGLGVEGGLMTGGFEEWWEEYLRIKPDKV